MIGREGGQAWLRWIGCFILVLMVHAVLIGGAMYWRRYLPSPVVAAQPQAVMIELAPVAMAPDVPPSDSAAGPRQQETMATPAAQMPRPQSEPTQAQRATPPLPAAPAALPMQQEQAAEQALASDAAPASAPPQVDASRSVRYAARQASAGSSNAAFADWQAQLLGHLERFKRYPRAAQRRRYQGVVQVGYTVDRQGNVLAVQLDRGSGHAPLDEEALAAVHRASPLPPPPADVPGDPVDVTTPVQFLMR